MRCYQLAKLNFDDNPVLWTVLGAMALILFITIIVTSIIWLDPHAPRAREDALISKCIEQGQNPVECATVFRQPVD